MILECSTRGTKDDSDTTVYQKLAENKETNPEHKENDNTTCSDDEEIRNPIQCVDCIFEKKLDKRNYYFGNLLIGELQFLPPCMRSLAYINILKYIDSLKHQHRNRNINTT